MLSKTVLFKHWIFNLIEIASARFVCKQVSLHSLTRNFQRCRCYLGLPLFAPLLQKVTLKIIGTVKITVKGRWHSGNKRGPVWSAAALFLFITLNRTSPGAPEWQRTAFNGKQQPTEGCRLRLVSKRLLWLILFCAEFFATFCHTESRYRKTARKIQDNWLKVKSAIKLNLGST